MKDSGISYQQIENFNLIPFWKKNEQLLKELERSEMPAKSRLIFKEITSNQDTSSNHIITSYDLVNIYCDRKNFLSIISELASDRSSIIRQEIVAGSKLSDAKKTVIDGSKISNKDQVEWIKEMSRNDGHQMFRV